jgi:hypothetical protein
MGPPFRLRTEPAVRRVSNNLRGIKWRKIRPESIVLILKRCPCGVNNKSR